MSNRTTWLLGIQSLLCAGVLAQPVQYCRIVSTGNGESQIVEVNGVPQGPPPGVTKLWDNWSDAQEGGVTDIHGTYRVGSSEFGEICHGAQSDTGWLSGFGFSFYNFSDSNLTRKRITHRFYTLGGALFTSITTLTTGTLRPGIYYRIYYDDGSLTGEYGRVPSDFIVTTQFSEFTGIALADAGILVGGPISAGSSPGYSFNRTTGEQVVLPNGDHSLVYVHTDTIPTTGSMAPILMAISFTLRRRR